ncbi:hypothetical protein D9758_014846 [Tetrapyrgos nigripes]|uniref:C3H1-type domain-containing protein n=1 Tax=Tetrapyrgos nigripes TaxID=182062 RepID=A0A8H5CU64_9AGAR|nr:hypothetical protein D9758_014846 [Tetrapyrgos nigripes]
MASTSNDDTTVSNATSVNAPISNANPSDTTDATGGTAPHVTQGNATAAPIASNSTSDAVRTSAARNNNPSPGSSSSATTSSGSTVRTKIQVPKTTLTECHAIVDRYRKHQGSKVGAVLEIQEKLWMVQGMSDQDRKGGLAAFLEISDESSNDNNIPLPLNDPSFPNKKAAKDDNTEYPWSSGNPLSAVAMDDLSPICRQTLRLLSKNLEDPKKALRSLLSSPLCPDLPESELKAILLGKPVNLDVVFTSLYSNMYTEDRTEDLADGIQIRFGNQVPSKQITDSNEWGVVWHKVGTAYARIFPHLEADVKAYGEYIHRQFVSVKKPFYSRVIHFDKAVRSRVANSRSIRFIDFSLFSDLRESHISDTGSCIEEAPQKSNCTTPTKSRVPCNNWNMGFCTASASTCTHLHICNVCDLPGHKGPKCPLLPNKSTPPSSTLPSKPPPSNVPAHQ